jgi:hypothetical protein
LLDDGARFEETSAISRLSDHIHQTVLQTLDSIPADERPDIYVVSLFVYDEEDDPRLPTVTVGFNTEADVAQSIDPAVVWATDEQEARWNYAFWRQNELTIACASYTDPDGAKLREDWARQSKLWYDLPEGEDALFNERGVPLTRAFVQLLVEVVQRLHLDGDIERVFGRTLPVLIHELEYYEQIAIQNLAANPDGVVPAGFVAWCSGE